MIVFVERDMCVLSSVRKLEAEVVKSKRAGNKQQSSVYKYMAKSYWDRWHQKLDERKTLIKREVDYLGIPCHILIENFWSIPHLLENHHQIKN